MKIYEGICSIISVVGIACSISVLASDEATCTSDNTYVDLVGFLFFGYLFNFM